MVRPWIRRAGACLVARAVQISLLTILLGGCMGSYAQTSDSVAVDTTVLRPRLERVLDAFGGADQTTAQAAERFTALAKSPLDLNNASAGDLSVLPGLSGSDAYRIVQHRRKQGPYQAWTEVREVSGITQTTVGAIRPFLTLTPPDPGIFPGFDTVISNLDFSLIQRYSRDLDLGRGYRTGRFLGAPGRLTTRLRLEHRRRLQLAMTLDKDPGEPLRWSPSTDTYGFDHISGSLTLRDLGPIETLVLGDFTGQFGQGIALWQGLRFGKGRDPVSPALQTGRGVVPYHSASEANFFRGIAATISLPAGLSLTAFASHRHRDASLDSSAAPSGPSSSSIPVRTVSVGGQHRTPSEIARKGTFGERTMGSALEYRASILHVGMVGYRARFDRPLRPGDRPSRRYRVDGRGTSMVSAYATAFLDDYTLFGEVARTPSGTYGGLFGAALNANSIADAILLGRWYPPQFAGLYGGAFGNGSRPQNEIGIYTGLNLQIARDWTLGVYFDQFRAPWLRFNIPRPTTGWETRAVLDYEPRPWLSTYLQVRTQSQEEATEQQGPGGRLLEAVQRERRSSLRWHTEYTFSDALTARTRIELSRRTTPASSASGVFLSQGLRWTPHPRVQLDAQLAFFDTDGFAARIYAYERDLLYSFSVPVFFDRGRRSYVLIRYEPVPSLTIEAKYGITTYDNRSRIGSGLNEFQGSSRREIRAQIRWTL